MSAPSRSAWIPVCCLVACLLTGFWRPAPAAREDRDDRGGTETGLIDMAEVFKRSDRFVAERARLRQEIESESAGLKPLVAQMRELAGELKGLKEGTEQFLWTKRDYEALKKEYKEGQETLAKKFRRQEADAYGELYDEVRLIVAEIAEERGLRLVIRYAREPDEGDEPEDPAERLKSMNRQIVYSDLPDLTDETVERLNDI